MTRRIPLVLSVVVILATILIPLPALAAGIFGNACNNDNGSNTSQSAVCQANGQDNPLTGPNGLLLKTAQIIAILAGIAAVIVVIASGLQYMMSDGDPAKAQQAKSTLIYASIGIIVIVVAESLVSLVLSKL